jgi:predicted  nucleic acid-binding Zn-ribbon protein
LIAHCGGDRLATDIIRIACRRCATLEAELVHIEDRLAKLRRQRKEPPHSLLQSYASLTAQQMRLSKALGWDRHAKLLNSEPKDLHEYLARKTKGDHPFEGRPEDSE